MSGGAINVLTFSRAHIMSITYTTRYLLGNTPVTHGVQKPYTIVSHTVITACSTSTANQLIPVSTGDFGTNNKIMRIWGSSQTANITFLFDASSQVPFCMMPAAQFFDMDFTEFGGITNNAGSGKTGDLLFSINAGITAPVAPWFIILLKVTS